MGKDILGGHKHFERGGKMRNPVWPISLIFGFLLFVSAAFGAPATTSPSADYSNAIPQPPGYKISGNETLVIHLFAMQSRNLDGTKICTINDAGWINPPGIQSIKVLGLTSDQVE